MSDIVERLQDRAIVARNEGTGTGLGDAIHFEEAASTITALEARVSELEVLMQKLFKPQKSLVFNEVALGKDETRILYENLSQLYLEQKP